ncbi:ATP-binding cassette domain-containing protein [Klebsiella michiganensis]|nr:ATP-binding cassette domain-containing protein [Klebsiella michiganensis]
MTNFQPYALAVDNITFRYPGGAPVFSHFSFHARQGEFVVLLGPSGCGKSTLLNLLVPVSQSQSGEPCGLAVSVPRRKTIGLAMFFSSHSSLAG